VVEVLDHIGRTSLGMAPTADPRLGSTASFTLGTGSVAGCYLEVDTPPSVPDDPSWSELTPARRIVPTYLSSERRWLTPTLTPTGRVMVPVDARPCALPEYKPSQLNSAEAGSNPASPTIRLFLRPSLDVVFRTRPSCFRRPNANLIEGSKGKAIRSSLVGQAGADTHDAWVTPARG
jgi:hypothetical protein